MLDATLRFIARWEWGQTLILNLLSSSASIYFNVVVVWPRDAEYTRVITFATDKFALMSYLTSWKDDDSQYRIEEKAEVIN